MTPPLHVLDLDRAGEGHLRDALGGEGLSGIVAPRLAEGRTAAIVPVGTDLARATAFDAGGLMSRRAAIEVLAGWLPQGAAPDDLVIAQDLWVPAAERGVGGSAGDLHDDSGCAYAWRGVADLDDGALADLVNWSCSFQGFLIRCPRRCVAITGDRIVFSVDLMDEGVVLAIDVYDQEGFLLWRPPAPAGVSGAAR